MIPKWWYIKKISYFTINRKTKFSVLEPLLKSWSIQYPEYEVYIEITSKVKNIYTNDWVKVNWLGNIKKTDLLSNIQYQDSMLQKEIKQWSRNKALEETGI